MMKMMKVIQIQTLTPKMDNKMIPSDKEITALIKKIQKKVGTNAKKREDTPKEEVELPPVSDEIFNEMKKLPFSA
jgi:hypothetical protein